MSSFKRCAHNTHVAGCVKRIVSTSTCQLDEMIYEMRLAAAKEPWVWKRTLKTLLRTGSLATAVFVHQTNAGWKKLARAQVPLDRERFGYEPTDNERTRKLHKAFSLRCGKPL